MSDILDYYARRAAEFDRVYEKPERHEDLRRLAGLLIEWLTGRDVLEVACGTGYWTAALAPHARSILATDAVSEVLELARRRCQPFDNVRFVRIDAFHLGTAASPSCDGGLAAFFWSHVPRQELRRFLAGLHATIAPDARVVLCDSRLVPGRSTELTRTDAEGNSYELRILDDGSRHEVLKNFPSAGEVKSVLASAGVGDIDFVELGHFWCARYALPRAETLSPQR